jgi:para-nitrobenzyl esterase
MKLFSMADPEIATLDEDGLVNRVAKLVTGADPLLDIYRASRSGRTPADLYNALATDRVFRLPAVRMLEAQLGHGADAWLYLFTWPSPVMGGALGSCHALEIPFVFGTYDRGMTAMFTGSGPDAAALAEAMQDAWLMFARTGRPGAPSLPAWPAYDTDRRATMVLGQTFEVQDDPASAERLAWEALI